jgi:hypothetical protein
MANIIINEYERQGYNLTLRQLYYQFVARDIIPNRQDEYVKLGKNINDARLAGLVDWDAIVDRTRNLLSLPNWDSSAEILNDAASQFKLDVWESQDYYIEVWIEKDALTGIIERVCNKWRIPFFSCRGYTSQSELWRAAQRVISKNKETIILHLGDHDPSGLDMTRDIIDRFDLFECYNVEVKRLALNMNQVDEHKPPPNPTKMADTRSKKYTKKFGYESWELDALNPIIINQLIEDNINPFINFNRWNEVKEKEKEHKDRIKELSKEF